MIRLRVYLVAAVRLFKVPTWLIALGLGGAAFISLLSLVFAVGLALVAIPFVFIAVADRRITDHRPQSDRKSPLVIETDYRVIDLR